MPKITAASPEAKFYDSLVSKEQEIFLRYSTGLSAPKTAKQDMTDLLSARRDWFKALGSNLAFYPDERRVAMAMFRTVSFQFEQLKAQNLEPAIKALQLQAREALERSATVMELSSTQIEYDNETQAIALANLRRSLI